MPWFAQIFTDTIGTVRQSVIRPLHSRKQETAIVAAQALADALDGIMGLQTTGVNVFFADDPGRVKLRVPMHPRWLIFDRSDGTFFKSPSDWPSEQHEARTFASEEEAEAIARDCDECGILALGVYDAGQDVDRRPPPFVVKQLIERSARKRSTPADIKQAAAKLWLALPVSLDEAAEEAAREVLLALGIDPDRHDACQLVSDFAKGEHEDSTSPAEVRKRTLVEVFAALADLEPDELRADIEAVKASLR